MIVRNHDQELLGRRHDTAHRMHGELLYDAVDGRYEPLQVRLLAGLDDLLH